MAGIPSHFRRLNTMHRCRRRWVNAGLWTEILGHLSRKPKGQLRFVDSAFIKVHQAGQGAIGGSKNQAIGLTINGLSTKLAASVERRGYAVALLLSRGSALKPQLPNTSCRFCPRPCSSSGTKASTRMNSDTFSRTTATWPASRLFLI